MGSSIPSCPYSGLNGSGWWMDGRIMRNSPKVNLQTCFFSNKQGFWGVYPIGETWVLRKWYPLDGSTGWNQSLLPHFTSGFEKDYEKLPLIRKADRTKRGRMPTCWTSQEIPGYLPIGLARNRSALTARWAMILSTLPGITGGSRIGEGRVSEKSRRNVSSAPLHVMQPLFRNDLAV